MGPFAIIVRHPFHRFFPDLIQKIEYIGAKQFFSDRSFTAFHIAVLLRFSRLDKDQLNALLPTPVVQQARDKLRAIVHANHFGEAPDQLKKLQYPDHQSTSMASISQL